MTSAATLDADDAYPFAEPFRSPQGSPIRELFKYLGRPGMISFAGGYPSKDLFDRQGFGRALEAAYQADPAACLQYGDTAGVPALRRSLARLMAGRGVRCETDDVIVTTGSQQGFDLLLRTLIAPGDTALIEQPAYSAAIQALRLAGANILTVRTDAHGIDVDALRAQLDALPAATRPKLLYTVPTFANPTGATMPQARREALARLAAERRFVLVEDDPYGELRFSGTPVPPILALAATIPEARDWIVYLGSLSKIVAPGVRIGWALAPAAIARRMIVAKQTSDLCTAPLAQEAVRHYLDSGRLAEHLGTIVDAYRKRCEALLNALRNFVPDEIEFAAPEGGMFVWARLAGGRDASETVKRAIEQNVMYVPGAAFFVRDADASSLRLSFAAPTEAEVFEGVLRLAKALQSR
ncbi:PLP-dependent aminotransferase family protein [Trinickia terrae]|uniref:PLP-dependent aminotransferase family protein n=1 Tax=Trinickia terrae TaxID=2571161 RepID=A0A4U1IG37_9BURK|nr:PLP-dependent aminotransferase family protein [Trinickia terrae]TKC92647.1 PLP-dependent aminotransferase family protein [Trinickia terrae]